MAEEMVAQILSRLPPKSVMRFKCVHKSWCALVNSLGFVNQHLNSYNKSSTLILVKRSVVCVFDYEIIVFSFLNLPNDSDGDESNLNPTVEDIFFPPSLLGLDTRDQFIDDNRMPFNEPHFPQINLIGHCDGIICLLVFDTYARLVLCNPAINEFRTLPGLISDANVAFGYDIKSNDYIVINIIEEEKHTDDGGVIIYRRRAKAYNLGTDSWLEINTICLETETTNFMPNAFEMCYKGVFYWWGNEQDKEFEDDYDRYEWENQRPMITFFDTADELFHNVLLPDCFYKAESGVVEMRIGVWNESYIAIYGFRRVHVLGQLFEIWVMDEFAGAKCSWINYVTAKTTLVIYPPAVLWKNHSVILRTADGRMVSCSFDMQKFTYLPIHCICLADFQAVICVHSIVSVKEGNKLDTMESRTYVLNK